jgi:hypothetical protein
MKGCKSCSGRHGNCSFKPLAPSQFHPLATNKNDALVAVIDFFMGTRVSIVIDFVGISIGIPMEIYFDFRLNYWSNLSKVIGISFSTVSIEILMSNKIEISTYFSEKCFEFQHWSWNLVSLTDFRCPKSKSESEFLYRNLNRNRNSEIPLTWRHLFQNSSQVGRRCLSAEVWSGGGEPVSQSRQMLGTSRLLLPCTPARPRIRTSCRLQLEGAIKTTTFYPKIQYENF